MERALDPKAYVLLKEYLASEIVFHNNWGILKVQGLDGDLDLRFLVQLYILVNKSCTKLLYGTLLRM